MYVKLQNVTVIICNYITDKKGMSMKKPTMQDIADQLQVSRNTVSRALRDKNGVSLETKKQVREVADQLGYRYAKQSNGEKLREVLDFKLISSSFALSQTSFFGIIIEELRSLIEKSGNTIEIVEVPLTIDDEKERILQELSRDRDTIDGIFILSHITDNYIEEIIDLDIPTVLIDHHSPQLHADSILTQNEYGAYILTEYLIGNGINEIGFIGNVDLSPSYEERFNGYKNALKKHNIKLDNEIVISDIEEEQRALFDRISALEKLPEAWFCVNSGLAFILNTFLHSKGYSIPEDFSIVCFDNTEFSRRAAPPITCMGVDLKYFSKRAVETMEYRLENIDDPMTQLRIVPELIERESVANKM